MNKAKPYLLAFIFVFLFWNGIGAFGDADLIKNPTGAYLGSYLLMVWIIKRLTKGNE